MKQMFFLALVVSYPVYFFAMQQPKRSYFYSGNNSVIFSPIIACWQVHEEIDYLSRTGLASDFIAPRLKWFALKSLDDLLSFVVSPFSAGYFNDSFHIHWWLKQQKDDNGPLTPVSNHQYVDLEQTTLFNILDKLDSTDSDQLYIFLKIIKHSQCKSKRNLIAAIRVANQAVSEGIFWTEFLSRLPEIITR